jgi:hypothetical protein
VFALVKAWSNFTAPFAPLTVSSTALKVLPALSVALCQFALE